MAVSEGLLALHPHTLKPVPACALSWERSKDQKSVTFHLRPDLKWSNGAPLTAHDFLYSWKRLLDPATASPYAYLLWDVEGAKAYTEGRGGSGSIGLLAPDPTTLKVRLAHPCPYFPTLAAFYPLFPVCRAALEAHGDLAWRFPERMVSNGPFHVKLRLLKDRIRLERNPQYWDAENVSLETVDALAVTSPITALNLYLTGQVDWINQVPPVVLPFIRDHRGFTLTPNLGTNFLRFNLKQPPLEDARVRRALSLAIDKEALVAYVLKGGQRAATSFVPPGIPRYTPPVIPVFDPARARTLLSEAGFPDGRGFPELNLLYSADDTNRDLAEVIALQLKKHLGIRIHPTAQERKGYFVSQNTFAYHLCLCSWLGDYLDVSTFLDVFRSGSGNNRTGWKSEPYDELLTRASRELDPDLRADLMARAENLLLKEMPIAPLYFRTTANMIQPGWEGYFDNVQDVHPLKHLKRRTP
jgi:oligopeptide transport system substrate-binding protein